MTRSDDHLDRSVLTGEAAGRLAGVRARQTAFGWGLSLAAHFGLLLIFIALPHPPLPPMAEPGPISVTLISAPITAPTPAAPKPSKPAPQKPVKAAKVRITKTPRPVPSPVAATTARPAPSNELSETDLASASTAGSGQAGRECNMVDWLQNALRRDPEVREALAKAQSPGKATLVWNGEWLRNAGEDGEGLAIVREAVMVKVAFAPEACKSDPVHGLVLISLSDGGPRLAMGGGSWRWRDLLFTR